MKTIEEKAKAYDEVLKQIKECTPDENGFITIYPQEIFPELKESEDEKVRKALIKLFEIENLKRYVLVDGIDIEDVLGWLERQGEHANFLNKIQVGDKVTRNEAGVLVNLSQLERVAKPSEKQSEQKPAWSEEDEKIINGLIDSLTRISLNTRTDSTSPNYSFYREIDWLKSLRPQNYWKPSELQLGCLSDAIEHYNSLGYPAPKLKELLYDLKKLKGEV